MVGYRCYLLDAEDHILQAYDVDCQDDAAAEMTALSILHQDPYHRAVEVWQRTRRIGKLDRNRPLEVRPALTKPWSARAPVPVA